MRPRLLAPTVAVLGAALALGVSGLRPTNGAAEAGDPWAGMARRARSLREPIRRLERMRARARG